MSFLDELRAAPNSPTASWNTFVIEYRPDGKAVFVIHEGRDDPSFYRHHVAGRMPVEWTLRFVCCGTKKEVIKRSEEFAVRYAEDPRVLFFVDRDHDALVDANAERPYRWTYTTSCYAIENLVCTPQVVRAFLTDIVGVPDMDPSCDMIASRYNESKAALHEAGMPVMAWIVAARRLGISVNLNNLDTGKLFRVKDDLTPELVDDVDALYSYLAATTGGNGRNQSPPDEDIRTELKRLKELPSETWFRGKQDLWFLVRFLLAAVRLLAESKKKTKVRVSLSPVNALQILGPRASMPRCLAHFLDAAFAELKAGEGPAR